MQQHQIFCNFVHELPVVCAKATVFTVPLCAMWQSPSASVENGMHGSNFLFIALHEALQKSHALFHS